MPKSTMNLATIVQAFADGTSDAHETLFALRQLDRTKEVFRTLLEQACASTTVNNWDATREAAASILASLQPEEEVTTGETAPAPGTITVARADLDNVLYLARLGVRTRPTSMQSGCDALARLMHQMYPNLFSDQEAAKPQDTATKAGREEEYFVGYDQLLAAVAYIQDYSCSFAIEPDGDGFTITVTTDDPTIHHSIASAATSDWR